VTSGEHPAGRSGGPGRRALLGAGLLGLAGLGAGGVAANRGAPAPAAPQDSARAAAPVDVDAAVAHRWAGHYLAIVQQSGVPAPAAAQMLAELGVVLHAAVRVSTARGDDAQRLPARRGGGALGALALPAGRPGTDPALVADAALAWLLTRRYVDTAGPALAAAAADTEAAFQAAAPRLRGPAREAGEAVGRAVLAWSLRDLAASGRAVPRSAPPGPGSWVPTPPDLEQPVLPYWGTTPTMVLERVETPPDPPEFSTAPGSERHRLAVEVRDTVASLTADQLAVARHWADGKWTVNPAGHWLRIATSALAGRDADLALTAEVLLRLGASQHDAFVSCWHTKYATDVMRPITYVRAHLGDPAWTPPVPTPCFPEYTSGHATQSAAAAAVLGSVLGEGPFTDATDPSRPARSYPSFAAAAEEAAVSRLYGGIHFSVSNTEGLACGRRIGAVVAALELRA
jgi:hypothetical protein